MNALDLILIALLLLAAVKGWRIGIVQALTALVGLILAYGLALSYGGVVAGWISDRVSDTPSAAAVVGFVCIFLATLVAFYLLGRVLRGIVRLSPLGLVDAVGGAVAGVANGVLILGLFVLLLRAHPFHDRIPAYIDGSALGMPVQRAAMCMLDVIRSATPRAARLYKDLGIDHPNSSPPTVIKSISGRAEATRAKLDSLVRESRRRLESEP